MLLVFNCFTLLNLSIQIKHYHTITNNMHHLDPIVLLLFRQNLYKRYKSTNEICTDKCCEQRSISFLYQMSALAFALLSCFSYEWKETFYILSQKDKVSTGENDCKWAFCCQNFITWYLLLEHKHHNRRNDSTSKHNPTQNTHNQPWQRKRHHENMFE